tara:strand:- start:8742 stop:9629 length:888 start_codon:yes stop_codon:yes gene_type:complete
MQEYLNLLYQFESLQWGIIIFLGLIIGSLLNVINNRTPLMMAYENAKFIKNNCIKATKEVEDTLLKYKDFNLFFPSSRCPKCNKEIKFYQNIPIISYLFLLGKCSNCKTKISLEYPLVEALNVTLWVLAYINFGFTIELVFVLFLLTSVLSISIIDAKFQIIPDTIQFLLLLCAFYMSTLGYINIDIQEMIITSIFVYFILLGFFSSYEKIRGFEEHIFGRGDIKYLAVISAWVGFVDLLNVIIYSVVFSLIFYSVLFLIKKQNILEKITPFAPSISISFLIIYFDILLPKLIII